MSTHSKPGYAAGNILNMLVHLGADLTGYDFSGLSVWRLNGVALSILIPTVCGSSIRIY
jgi:hypothetical protein